MAGFPAHLNQACIGSISEVFDAEAPPRRGAASRRRGAWRRCCGQVLLNGPSAVEEISGIGLGYDGFGVAGAWFRSLR